MVFGALGMPNGNRCVRAGSPIGGVSRCVPRCIVSEFPCSMMTLPRGRLCSRSGRRRGASAPNGHCDRRTEELGV
jgi:hypothetical protein